ncbi:MAG: class I SAM-dependent methyltransferase [Bacteroidales bacterium]|nr:class I SAM-dependent methyltransferase [Bacteroidales bacterium]
MKPNYKNWVPVGMILEFLGGAVLCLILFYVFGVSNVLSAGILKTILKIVFLVAAIICFIVAIWSYLMYRAFSYDGKRQLSKQVIEGVAEYVTLPDGGKGLDVGCGSGALAIAVAKRNPNAEMVGIDRWAIDYASYNLPLCEQNAKAEGVSNVSFAKGNALKLEFPNESFDVITSNYVYHNIVGHNHQDVLLESFRVLKKGGTFVIHDIFSKREYGDMQAFMKKLEGMGYENVKMIDTTQGMFMTPWEAKWMTLSGSAILTGKK